MSETESLKIIKLCKFSTLTKKGVSTYTHTTPAELQTSWSKGDRRDLKKPHSIIRVRIYSIIFHVIRCNQPASQPDNKRQRRQQRSCMWIAVAASKLVQGEVEKERNRRKLQRRTKKRRRANKGKIFGRINFSSLFFDLEHLILRDFVFLK